MNYPWLDETLRTQQGATKEYKQEWEATVYRVGNKMFAMVGGDKAGKPIVSLKCEPNYARSLREEYPDIIPGYYLNKEHWNSLYLEGTVPDELVRSLCAMSYELVLSGLTKKAQAQIREETGA